MSLVYESVVFSAILMGLFMVMCGILLWRNNKLEKENAVLNTKLRIVREELDKIMADYDYHDGSDREQTSVPWA